MATLTAVDLVNASRYATHRHRLNYIPRWRAKLPHILVDYEIRAADHDDYYVPPKLADRALAVRLTFSARGCESMSCFPFHETGVVDAVTLEGATQTSETAISYAQPACYHLDRAAAVREGAENEVQAPELRFASGRCILVDTIAKMYLNAPYLRSDEHVVKGVHDVPAFNVTPETDPLWPERFRGTFNEAYCRRFGRDLINGGCTVQWWESLIGFVLGDTIYITFKLLVNNIFSELRNFNFQRPSPILPPKPTIDSTRRLNEWRQVRDTFVDLEFEKKFSDFETLADLGIVDDTTKLVYTAERGFTTQRLARRRRRLSERIATEADVDAANLDEASLEDIISQFLEDHSFVFGILASFGFDMLIDGVKALLKRINKTLLPALKRVLLTTTKRVTVKMLGETFKAAMVHQFARLAIKTVSAVAKALTKIAIQAASVVGIVLIIMTLMDLVLAFWDPFGYNNMFPREFPDDMARSFLAAFYESMGESRDLIEFLPEYFDDLVEDDEDNGMLESIFYILDYVSELEVNSNGQRLDFDKSDVIEDFDEVTLVGSALASSALYTYLDFLQYTQRHNDVLLVENKNAIAVDTYLGVLLIFCGALLYPVHNRTKDKNVAALFFLVLLLALYVLIRQSLDYYLALREHANRVRSRWFDNLYT